MSTGYPRAWAAGLVLAGLILTVLSAGVSCRRETAPEVRAPGAVPAAPPVKVSADDWPGWGGPNGNNIATSELTTTRWSPKENLRWKSEIPGRGHATPIVIGSRVVVTTADEEAGQQMMLAFDRNSGAERWRTVIHRGTLPRKHPKNSHASATPVCDGTNIFVPFASEDGLFLTAVDLEGHIAWQTRLGPFASEHGYGSSPVLYESLVIVLGDHLQDSYVAAVHRESGEIVWRTKRESTGQHASYGTPALLTVGGKTQLAISGVKETAGYDPGTGQLLWKCPGPSEVTANQPVFDGELLFSSGGYPEREIIAIRVPTRGAVDEAAIVWRSAKGPAYVPTPLYRDGRLFVVGDGGVVTCYDAKTGEDLWQGRITGVFSASPVCAGDTLIVPNEDGKAYLLGMGDTFEVLAENDLKDGGFASPVVASGQLFLRTNHHLYCIGSANEDAGSEQEDGHEQ